MGLGALQARGRFEDGAPQRAVQHLHDAGLKQGNSDPAPAGGDVLNLMNRAASAQELSVRGTGSLEMLRRLWEQWKRIARRIGDVQARVLLMIFYLVVLAPFALIVRWATDPLAIKPGTPRGWRTRREERGSLLERATKQS